jgi:BlaR1 peptidase M56
MGEAEEAMIVNYWARLAWLALASFFLLHLPIASVVSLAVPRLVRFASLLQPRIGARLLFISRLVPWIVALVVVAAVCIPSYIYFEPEAAGEQIGPLCIAAALLTLLLLISSTMRAARAVVQSSRHMCRWRRDAHPEPLAGCMALVIENNVPFLALAGILRPTLIASRGLLNTLDDTELDAAVGHEQAHRVSRDNMKRLLMHCAPGLLPFFPGFTALEQAWAKLAERAADDRSVRGNRERALHLADALVRVARSGCVPQPPALMTPLLPEGTDLRQRVDRLLDPVPASASLTLWRTVLAGACLVLALLQPLTLRLAHELLECLAR